MRSYLFVGGPWDGQWHGVPPGRAAYRVPEPLPVAEFREATDPEIGRELRLVTYYRRTVTDGVTEFTVYVAEDVELTEGLARHTIARWLA